jgi:hypothetical protein
VFGGIVKIDWKGQTIAIRPTQSGVVQYQAPIKPGQGPKGEGDAEGLMIIAVSESTTIQLPGGKGFLETPAQGPKVKPGPGQGPLPRPLSRLQVGQLVQVTYNQENGRPQALQIRVLRASQAQPASPRVD